MIVLYILLGLIALILIVAALTGRAWSYEQSILINAPLDTVWTNVKTLHAINQWNPWMSLDPNMKLQYTGTDGTPGASFSWDSPVKNAGAGSQTILRVVDRKLVDTRIDFLRPFKGSGLADFEVTVEKTLTRVSWSINSSTPYPMNIIKLFGVIKKNMARDFSKGLGKLKAICEA
jgi:hypothetical protein